MKFKLKEKEIINGILIYSYLTVSLISKILQLFLGINREIIYVLFLFILVLNIIYNSEKKLKDVVFFYIIVGIIFISGILNNIKYISYDNIALMLINVLPAYFIFRINIKEKILYKIYKQVIIINILGYFPLAMFTQNYMDFSYNIAINGSLALCMYMYKKNIFMLCAYFLSIFCLITNGSRGTILCIAFYSIYVVISNLYLKSKKLLGIFILIFITIISNYEFIIRNLYNIFPNSRVVFSLFQGVFIKSEGRIILYEYCKELIVKNKLGYGPLATRSLISWQPYPHSLILELLIDYGVFLGGVIFIGVLYIGKKLILKQSFICQLGKCYWIIGFIMLLISGSFYYNPYLFIAFAFFIRSKNQST